MTQHWRKLGLLYSPAAVGSPPELQSHAANPLPVQLDGDIFRIFFSGRDKNNRSSVGAVDIDIVTRKIVKDHKRVFFRYGPPGSFYADGVSIGNCYEANGRRYMLFMGWQTPDDGHWRGDIGRLIVSAELDLESESNAPFMGAEPADPISLSYPWVEPRPDGGYDMWYGTTQAWDAGNAEMLHTINYASSVDGDTWNREGLAIPFELGVAQAFSRPTVSTSPGGQYEMWFSYRRGDGGTYRIGYAVSADGRAWRLALDAAGIDVAETGWDSEMIEYPYVFSHKGEKYMLYNGNGYGRTGFGLAILEQSR